MKDSHTNQEAGKQSAEQAAIECGNKWGNAYNSLEDGQKWDAYMAGRKCFIAGSQWQASQPTPAKGDDVISKEEILKNNMVLPQETSYAGYERIKIAMEEYANLKSAPQAVKWVQASEREKQLEQGIRYLLDWMEQKRPRYTAGFGAPIAALKSLLEGSTDKNETK